MRSGTARIFYEVAPQIRIASCESFAALDWQVRGLLSPGGAGKVFRRLPIANCGATS